MCWLQRTQYKQVKLRKVLSVFDLGELWPGTRDPQSGHIQEATNKGINKWHSKLMFDSFSLKKIILKFIYKRTKANQYSRQNKT